MNTKRGITRSGLFFVTELLQASLIPWGRIVLDELIVSQLTKKTFTPYWIPLWDHYCNIIAILD
jgi:hypothetical protein